MTGLGVEGRLLFCAALAYQANEQYRKPGTFMLPRGFRLVARLGDAGNPRLGYVVASRKVAAVVFRGTKDIFDLIRDVDWKPVPNRLLPDGAGGQVHAGFARLYEQVVRPQLKRVASKLRRRAELLLVGHSMGGALAMLAALDLANQERIRNPFVCTIGCPKVGDAAFVAAYHTAIRRSVRVVNRYDLVPRYPLVSGQQGQSAYQHVHTAFPIPFLTMSVLQNHSIDSYFRELAARYPEQAVRLRDRHPGLSPPGT